MFGENDVMHGEFHSWHKGGHMYIMMMLMAAPPIFQ
jgi:hypothetical protein